MPLTLCISALKQKVTHRNYESKKKKKLKSFHHANKNTWRF